MKLKTVLAVAGSDCSGGAGIQADIKTVTVHHLYGMSVITAVTAQNTQGVQDIYAMPASVVAAQLDSIFSDIVPDAVKIGMVYTADTVHAIAEKLRFYGARHVVIDPVLFSSSGRSLLENAAREVLVQELFPLAEIITPNLPEFNELRTVLVRMKCSVLVKGGHDPCTADDVLYDSGALLAAAEGSPGICRFRSERIGNRNIHGTGCTLSSAIACGLALECSVPESVKMAKDYVTGAIRAGLELGHGHGPLDHGWAIPFRQ
jgi:hydroxymethylpyrimidine/phosphomethylpyrimidine kinase